MTTVYMVVFLKIAAIQELQGDLRRIDKIIGFAYVIPKMLKQMKKKLDLIYIYSDLHFSPNSINRVELFSTSTLLSLPSAKETSDFIVNIKVPFKFFEIPQAAFPFSNGEE